MIPAIAEALAASFILILLLNPPSVKDAGNMHVLPPEQVVVGDKLYH